MAPNLQLLYLHLDAGNYKTFGAAVFANPNQWTPQKAEQAFRKQLIDTEFFYCSNWQLPALLPGDPGNQGDWYEFVKFLPTTKAVTDARTLEDFLTR